MADPLQCLVIIWGCSPLFWEHKTNKVYVSYKWPVIVLLWLRVLVWYIKCNSTRKTSALASTHPHTFFFVFFKCPQVFIWNTVICSTLCFLFLIVLKYPFKYPSISWQSNHTAISLACVFLCISFQVMSLVIWLDSSLMQVQHDHLSLTWLKPEAHFQLFRFTDVNDFGTF